MVSVQRAVVTIKTETDDNVRTLTQLLSTLIRKVFLQFTATQSVNERTTHLLSYY